jgi:branched-chain amino acid transport system permease protein
MVAQTSEFLPFPNLLPEWAFLSAWERLGPSEFVIIATTVFIMILLTLFVKFTA